MFDTFEMDSVDSKRAENPIWALDLDDDKAVLEWLNSELKFLEKDNEDRIREIKHNLARYKGIHYQTSDTRAGNRDREAEQAKYSPKMVVNLLAQAADARVSGIVKFKPSVAILPANDEHQDKVSSRIAKAFLDYIQYQNRFEMQNLNVLRAAEICGEGYIDIKWNPDLGPEHPDYDGSKSEPLLDDKGNEVLGKDGKPILIDSPVRVGDVEYKPILPLFLFFEKKDYWNDSNYAFHIEKVPTAELRKDYPDKATEIKSDSARQFYNVGKLEDERLQNETIKITFQHKKTRYLPKGRWIVFTKDTILENGPHKYDDGEFSFERLPSREIPGEQHAKSFFANAKAINAQYNNINNSIIRNQALVASPKWFLPRGSLDVKALGNDITIAQYQGSQPPVLAQQNPTPAEVFNFRAALKEEFMQASELGDVIRGEPPPGIKAGVALQFLAEQESQISNARVVAYNEYIRRVAQKTIKRAAQFYDPSDKRSIMVLGKNKSWVSINFDPKHLSRPFDIRIQNSSALPDSKAARTQTILDMAERFPNLFQPEQVIEMLDFGQAEEFNDEASAAVRAAEYENEKMLGGEEVAAPEAYEMHILHWKIHLKAMQDASFKDKKTPENIRRSMIDHMMATEMLMVEEGSKNPLFAQQLQQLPQFPIFFTPYIPEMAPPPPPPDGAGAMPPEQMPPLSQTQSDMMPPDQLPPDEFAAAQPQPVGEMYPEDITNGIPV